jgi:hypothetical protein
VKTDLEGQGDAVCGGAGAAVELDATRRRSGGDDGGGDPR